MALQRSLIRFPCHEAGTVKVRKYPAAFPFSTSNPCITHSPGTSIGFQCFTVSFSQNSASGAGLNHHCHETAKPCTSSRNLTPYTPLYFGTTKEGSESFVSSSEPVAKKSCPSSPRSKWKFQPQPLSGTSTRTTFSMPRNHAGKPSWQISRKSTGVLQTSFREVPAVSIS